MTLTWNVQQALRSKIIKVHFIALEEARKLISAGFIVIIAK